MPRVRDSEFDHLSDSSLHLCTLNTAPFEFWDHCELNPSLRIPRMTDPSVDRSAVCRERMLGSLAIPAAQTVACAYLQPSSDFGDIGYIYFGPTTAGLFTTQTLLTSSKWDAINNTVSTYRFLGGAIRVWVDAEQPTGVMVPGTRTLTGHTGAAYRSYDNLIATSAWLGQPFGAEDGCMLRAGLDETWLTPQASQAATAGASMPCIYITGLTPGQVIHFEVVMFLEMRVTAASPLDVVMSEGDPHWAWVQTICGGDELYHTAHSLTSVLKDVVAILAGAGRGALVASGTGPEGMLAGAIGGGGAVAARLLLAKLPRHTQKRLAGLSKILSKLPAEEVSKYVLGRLLGSS